MGTKLINIISPSSGREMCGTLSRGGEQIEGTGSHRFSVNDSSAALIAGMAGLGVLCIYVFMVQPYIQSGALHAVLPDWDGERVPVHLAYPANRDLAHKVRFFVDRVSELFRAQG